ncbi:MAG: hypothetical protein ACP5D2_02050 [Candidatus Nanoarchaeia archaeon]
MRELKNLGNAVDCFVLCSAGESMFEHESVVRFSTSGRAYIVNSADLIGFIDKPEDGDDFVSGYAIRAYQGKRVVRNGSRKVAFNNVGNSRIHLIDIPLDEIVDMEDL